MRALFPPSGISLLVLQLLPTDPRFQEPARAGSASPPRDPNKVEHPASGSGLFRRAQTATENAARFSTGDQCAVDDAEAVGLLHGFGDLAQDDDFFGQGETRGGLVERLAVDVLHRDVGLTLHLADLVDLAHMWVVDAGLGARLLHEAHDHVGIAAANELERNDAVQALVARFVHGSHAALTEQLQELVALPVCDWKLAAGGSSKRHSSEAQCIGIGSVGAGLGTERGTHEPGRSVGRIRRQSRGRISGGLRSLRSHDAHGCDWSGRVGGIDGMCERWLWLRFGMEGVSAVGIREAAGKEGAHERRIVARLGRQGLGELGLADGTCGQGHGAGGAAALV